MSPSFRFHSDFGVSGTNPKWFFLISVSISFAGRWRVFSGKVEDYALGSGKEEEGRRRT